MRHSTFIAMIASMVPAGYAAVGRDFSAAADSAVYVRSAVNATALVADGGRGTGVDAAGDVGVRARGSMAGIRADAEYYGIETLARNGAGLRAKGTSMGVSAQGGAVGVNAAGEGAGVIASATVVGGVGVKGNAEHPKGLGVWGEAGVYGSSSPAAVGVVGYGMGARAVGVSGVTAGDQTVAVLGTALGADAWSGYFEGDVAITGVCSPCVPADTAFQRKSKPITAALAKILALKPKSYEAPAPDAEPAVTGNSRRFGFSAHEVGAVVPELVHRVKGPAPRGATEQWNSAEPAMREFAALNYQELVPLLVRAIQEQQAEIETLKKEVASNKR